MGFYIEAPSPKDKAAFLVKEHGAELLFPSPESLSDLPEDKALVVVVDNGIFEAAAFCYSDAELEAFKMTPMDLRPRTWLLMDREKAEELSGYGE
jgi:hypothetical protein